jgi:hypothetical protein
MKNTFKFGFLAIAFGVVIASCGGAKTEETPAVDTTVVAPVVETPAVDTTTAPVVDTTVKTAVDTTVKAAH